MRPGGAELCIGHFLINRNFGRGIYSRSVRGGWQRCGGTRFEARCEPPGSGMRLTHVVAGDLDGWATSRWRISSAAGKAPTQLNAIAGGLVLIFYNLDVSAVAEMADCGGTRVSGGEMKMPNVRRAFFGARKMSAGYDRRPAEQAPWALRRGKSLRGGVRSEDGPSCCLGDEILWQPIKRIR